MSVLIFVINVQILIKFILFNYHNYQLQSFKNLSIIFNIFFNNQIIIIELVITSHSLSVCTGGKDGR